ncbi:MAG TPA: hypothetical protein VFP40_07605 [Terriglobales bacterium]|nr:hypothetical protein [Terriglobales bacterium]
MWRLGIPILFCIFLAGCGGGGSSSTATSSGNSTSTPAPTGNPVANLKAPTVVDLGQGQTASGVDITVAAAAVSPAPNAQNLGVNSLTGRASASNTGGVIHRGASNRVILFGPGLNGQMTVTIGGLKDITVTNVSGITATDNTPGLAFTATAATGAALGARTVYLQNTSGDVTTFTGGLEVVQ